MPTRVQSCSLVGRCMLSERIYRRPASTSLHAQRENIQAMNGVCVCARARACMCLCACVRACVRASMLLACTFVCVRVCKQTDILCRRPTTCRQSLVQVWEAWLGSVCWPPRSTTGNPFATEYGLPQAPLKRLKERKTSGWT